MANIEIEGLKDQQEKFKRLMTDSPGMDKRLRDAIRKGLIEVQKVLQSQAASGLGMKSDPRRAARAVQKAVYKKIFGGDVNILQKRSAGRSGNYEPPRKGLPARGGNRWGVSDRTRQVSGYQGSDRGFILRFLNAGADGRKITSYTDTGGARHTLKTGSGNRGSIPASNWFGGASLSAMNAAAGKIEEIIDKIINEEFK